MKVLNQGRRKTVFQGCRKTALGKQMALMAAVAMAALFACAGVDAAQLTVNVQGVSDARGKVAVALFNQPDGYPKEDAKAIQRQFVAIDAQNNTAIATFDDLAPGTYAVSVFHDHDNSGKLETSFFGIPLKGYGFSQNVNPSMRAANFDEAKFDVAEPGAAMSITLIYR